MNINIIVHVKNPDGVLKPNVKIIIAIIIANQIVNERGGDCSPKNRSKVIKINTNIISAHILNDMFC